MGRIGVAMNKQESLIRRSIQALVGLKDAMHFPGWGGQGSGGTGPIWNVLGPSWNSVGAIDYRAECGDLGGASLVVAAVNWLGRVLPEAPLTVVEIDDEGMEIPVPNHPAAMLWRKPNPYYSGTTLCKAYGYSWIVSGNPYFIKVRNGAGVVTELWYVPPHMMRPLWPATGNEFITGYEYRVDGATYVIPQEDVLHFRDGIDPSNTRLGLSPVASVMREIYTDQQIASYSALLMKNGAVPPVVISLKESVNALGVNLDSIREKYLKQTQGDERGKAWVSGNAVQVDKVGFSPADLTLGQLRRLPEERLAAVMGIPAIVLGYGAGLDKATYSNARQLVEYATESYLVPLYRYIEEELTTQLLPDFTEGATGLEYRFDLSGVRALSEDQDALYQRLTLGYQGGWLKRSEAREMAGYEWGPEDEVYKAPEASPLGGPGGDMSNLLNFPAKPKPAATDTAEEDTGKGLAAKLLEGTITFDEWWAAVGMPPRGNGSVTSLAEAKVAPAVGSDAVLDSAVPWLLRIGEAEVAAMLAAKPRRAIAHE